MKIQELLKGGLSIRGIGEKIHEISLQYVYCIGWISKKLSAFK